MKRKLLTGLAAVAVAAGAGGAYAATQSSSNPRQAYLNDVAKRLHVSPQQLSGALKAAALDQIQAAVAAGRITQAQANELKQRIGRGGRPGFFGFGHRFGLHPHAGALHAAASYLGLTEPQLFQRLASGQSLRQIAAARGKTVSGLKTAIATAVKQRLDRAVSANMITKAQEQAILSNLSARLDRLVNRSMPRFGFRPPGRAMGWQAAPPPDAPGPVAPGV